MPRAKSALKRQRQQERRRQRNQSVRTELRTYTKRAREAIASGNDPTAELRSTQKKLDHAVSKGAIHPNKAARTKSRLAKAANKKTG